MTTINMQAGQQSGQQQQLPQQINLDIEQLSKDLKDAIDQVKEMQNLIIQFVDTIVVRKNDAVEKETQAIKSTIKKVHTVKSELDKIAARYSKLRLIQIHSVPLGNAGYITLDPTEERNEFYQKLIESYTWLKNLDEDVSKLTDLMKDNYSPSTLVVESKIKLIDVFNKLKQEFPSVSFSGSYVASHCCIELTVGANFVVYLFFTGIELSFVKVKSVNESIELELTEDTRHHVFQRMTDFFISKILKLSSEDYMRSTVEFVEFLIGYPNVFKTRCKICGKYLCLDSHSKTLLPPLVRLEKSKDMVHFSCQTWQ